jgi:hypothetical protein
MALVLRHHRDHGGGDLRSAGHRPWLTQRGRILQVGCV